MSATWLTEWKLSGNEGGGGGGNRSKVCDLQAVRWWPCGWRALGLHSLSGARCSLPPYSPPDTPWEEVCCAVAALNQHRPNEVSHLTPSSLRPSHGCQSHNEQPSISSAWLTHFDSWESLGPVRSKLPLSKCHRQRIHQPHLSAFSQKNKQKRPPPQKSFPCFTFETLPSILHTHVLHLSDFFFATDTAVCQWPAAGLLLLMAPGVP